MKRDVTGKFVQNWQSETKQRVSISLTNTAWQALDQEAHNRGISRSEVIEHFARSLAPAKNLVEPQSDGHPAITMVVEQKVATVLESITDAFVAFDHNWRYTYVNWAAAQLLQRSPGELIGKQVWEEVFPELVGGIAYQAMHQAVAEQVPISWEEFGEPLQCWVEVSAYPSSEGIAVYFRNITERKQAEVERERLLQALETERTRFEAVLQQMPAGVMIADAVSGTLVLANEQAKQIIGYDFDVERPREIEEYNGITPFTAFTATGQPYAPEDYPLARSLRRGEVITNEEIELHQHSGGKVFITVNSAPILDAQEQVVAAVVVFQDISDRKQLEVKLQRREQQFKTLADNAPDIIARFDHNLRHMYVSRAIEQATGLPASQYCGKTHAELGVPADLCQLWQDRMQECFLNATGCRFEFNFMTPRGVRYYQTQMVTELAADGSVESLLGLTRDITEYKQVEQALRRSEELYRSLVASLPQLVCLTDAEGSTYYCNQTWIDFTGLTLEQTVGNGWQQAFHPADLPIVFRRWLQALRQGRSYSLECRIQRSNGVYRWHLSRITPIRTSNDQVIGWLGTATDIDEQKRTEQTQRFLAQASRTFAAAHLDLQIVLDTITHLVSEFTNDVCVLNLLSPDRQWLTHASFYHPDANVRQFVGNLLETYPRRADEGVGGRVMQTGEPLLFCLANDEAEYRTLLNPEYQCYLDRFNLCSTLIVPLNIQGETIGVLSLTRHHPAEPHQPNDITLFQDLADRAAMAIANARLYQQAEQARQRAEQTADRNARLQLVTAALSESLTPAQVGAVIVEQSQAALKATAAIVAVLRENRTDLEIVHSVGHPADLTREWQRFAITDPMALAEAVRTKTPIWEESWAARSDRYPQMRQIYAQSNYAGWISLPLIVEGRAIGGMSLSFTQFPTLSDDDRAFMLALAQQCAQAIVRAQLYEAEQQARAEAEAANRMKDEFLAVLSHELRTPMNPILGWAKLLQTGRLTPEKTAVAIETIERNAKLQVQLIEDLLDISRILRGKLSLNSHAINLATIIRSAIETVRLAAEAKAIQICTQIQSPVGCVLGDPTRLQQVVWNLLTNAVKFTPAQGRITITLEQVDDMIQLQIQDTGKGIEPEFLPYVFDTFRQADSSITRSFGGLGLGLAIVRYIVELHGGSVQAASPGEHQGSTFTVQLPLINQLEQLNQSAPGLAPLKVDNCSGSGLNVPLAGLKILVVDDETDGLELVQFILEQSGAAVVSATSAAAALEKLSQMKLDVLVADIGMPVMDGYALLQHLRTLQADQGGKIPAIALTAYTRGSDREKALAAGFQAHLAKPVEPNVLLERIIELLGAGSVN